MRPERISALAAVALAGALACGSGGGGSSTSGGTDGGASAVTYVISGTVAGESGVTVSLAGASAAMTATDDSGRYSFTGLAAGSYTVTPSKGGYRYSPLSRAVTVNGADVSDQNFSAAATHSISGKIAGASGVTVSLSGDTSWTTTTDASGSYSFAGLVDGHYTVTPSKAGFAFAPLNAAVSLKGGDAAVGDFAATAAAAVYSVSGTVTGVSGVTVSLSGANTGSVAVDESGHFAFAGLLSGSYTLTPYKRGYAFDPPSLAAPVAGADVTGEDFAAITHTISGKVTGAPGAKVTLSGPTVATTTADASGNYSFSGLGDLTYTVAAAKSGYLFAPTSAAVAVNGEDVTAKDFVVSSRNWYLAGNATGALWGAAPNDVWAVTQNGLGSSAMHWDGFAWASVPVPIGYASYTPSIWGSSASDVWIAAANNAAHWNGTRWSAVALPGSVGKVNNLFGRASNDVWAVGPSVIAHWDGAAWTDLSWHDGTRVTTANLVAGWSGGSGDVWVAGGSTILHWDGSAWKDWSKNADGTSLTTKSIYSLWGTPNDLWAVGSSSQGGSVILHWDGTAWTKSPHPGTAGLRVVWGSGADDVWALGTSLFHWNGATWQDFSMNGDGTFVLPNGAVTSAVGFGPDSLMAMSGNGKILLWDGKSWTFLPSHGAPSGGALYGVGGSAMDDVWVVGSSGAVLHWDGAAWRDMSPRVVDGAPYTTGYAFNGVWSSAAGDAWVVGGGPQGNTILHWDGAAWSEKGNEADGTRASTRTLHGVWGSAPGDVWAVGDGGAILHWDGGGWTDMSSDAAGVHLTWESLRTIFGLGPSNVWAAGGGALLHWDGSAWTKDPRPFTQMYQAYAVWGTSPNDLWVAGQSNFWNAPMALHFDGSSWKDTNVPLSPQQSYVSGIWGTAPDDVWAGWGWGFYHWDGAAWTELDETFSPNALWGAGSSLVAVGLEGLCRLDE